MNHLWHWCLSETNFKPFILFEVLHLCCAETHSLLQKDLLSRQMKRAQQTAQDSDGGLKQIHIHVPVEGQLLLYPLLGLLKLWVESDQSPKVRHRRRRRRHPLGCKIWGVLQVQHLLWVPWSTWCPGSRWGSDPVQTTLRRSLILAWAHRGPRRSSCNPSMRVWRRLVPPPVCPLVNTETQRTE